MKLFCKHEWEEIARTYARGVGRMKSCSWVCADEVLELVNGKTTILWKCKKCPASRKEEMIGREIEK